MSAPVLTRGAVRHASGLFAVGGVSSRADRRTGRGFIGPSGAGTSVIMRCIRTAVLAALACACASGAAAEYRTFEVESLRVTVDSDWLVASVSGYLPVRFDITNLGDDRVIELVGQGTRALLTSGHLYSQGSLGVRRTLRLARGARVRLTMPVPAGADTLNIQFQLRENGRTLQTFGYANVVSSVFGGYAGTTRLSGVSALIVVASDSTYGTMAPAWSRSVTIGGTAGRPVGALPLPPAATTVVVAPGMTTVPGTRSGPTLDFILEPARLPASWLGYTSLRAVILGPKEWERLDADQRSALLTWTAAGGNLILVDGGLETLFPDAQRRPPLSNATARYFFGHVHLREATAIDAAGLESTLQVAEAAVTDPVWALPLDDTPVSTPTGGRFRLPIPGVEAVPARAYLVILLLFTVLIGPVHHVLLARARQRTLIVLTTPLISALFVVLLAGYVVIAEGFGVRGRAATMTLLDQASSRAATHAIVSLYASGGAPRAGLAFSRDLAVFPYEHVVSNEPIDQHLDLTESQRFTSGLIQARVPSNFETIGIRTARERLTIRREGGRLTAVNGLGATIRRLLYRDGGSYTLSNPLPAGATGELQPAALSGRDLLPAGDSALRRFEHAVDTQTDGSYLAVLETSPFWESGTTGVEERNSFHLVLGTLGDRP